ncbi:TauD/TfdA dioxygenase family protein [Candidatus Poriferisocius sp.]|uniref:TauD/TfdA dioxygenase family protein n=1 Tax=Candidatus Poriferisocius sp. TaxID=3101276 RepID=UPI003B5BB2A3
MSVITESQETMDAGYRLEVLPMSQHTGAEIHGVDLREPMDEATVRAIRTALLRWKVVFFRDQELTRDQHVAFGRRFGQVSPGHPTLTPRFPEHPEIVMIEKEHHRDNPDANEIEHRWHNDLSYMAAPPMGSILRAVSVPPFGSDTEWTNLAAAYATLSPPIRELIDEMTAVHHNVLHVVRGEPNKLARDFMSTRLRARHPVVTLHPETGERQLYVNPDYTSHIVELTRQESDHLLAMLNEHVCSREFTVRFQWRPGSIAFWDNRATAHIAPADVTPGHRRVMERITLDGTSFVGPTGFESVTVDGSGAAVPDNGSP